MRSLLTAWIAALSLSAAWADIQSSANVPQGGAARSAAPVVATPTKRQAETARKTVAAASLAPRVIARSEHKGNGQGVYPWRLNITATVFWVGEDASVNNPVHNHKSSWDGSWKQNFGGFDDPAPENRLRGPYDYRPKSFTPRQNPFYVALPYNDVSRGDHKPEASRVIPWYNRDFEGKGRSVCKGKWVQITYKNKHCFAQWEDCGPFTTEDWRYVFGDSLPQNTSNKNAGIDISPAIRDYLGIEGGTAKVHWRFVEFNRIPKGPWSKYGENNPFVNPLENPAMKAQLARLKALEAQRTIAQRAATPSSPRNS